MNEVDIKVFDITSTWTTAAQRQALGRILRPKPMSLDDIYERMSDYLRSGRVMAWKRVKGDPNMVALTMLENYEAKIVRIDGADYLVHKRPNRILQFLTLGGRK